jgi:LCP family protein required for cell wall assembly
MTILAIGSDTRSDNYLYGLADVIRIARVDFVEARIAVLDLPRDLWVEIPGIGDHIIGTHGKLNQAYLYGNPGMGYYDGPAEGPGLLARTLQKNFGIAVDHYGAINMQTFVKLVDAVGGIDVYLPEDVDGRPVDDHTVDLGYFYAGHQHLSGEAALRLARVRKRLGGFRRTENQTLVLCALRDKVLTPSVLPKAPQIAQSFFGSVQTDLSPAQISQLACLLPRVGSENLLLASVPYETFTQSRIFDPNLKNTTFIWDIDSDILQDYIDRFMAGEWPQPSAEDGPTCPDPAAP